MSVGAPSWWIATVHGVTFLGPLFAVIGGPRWRDDEPTDLPREPTWLVLRLWAFRSPVRFGVTIVMVMVAIMLVVVK